MLDSRSTTREIGERRPEIAVFAIGAIQQFSVHLPVATDWMAVVEVARGVAEALDAFLVPDLPFSMSQCHGPSAGTVWLKPRTLAAVVRDTVLSLYAQGFRKVLILNGHGGNFVLEPEIRRLNLAHADLTVLMPGEGLVGAAGPRILEKSGEVHGGEGATSRQLHSNRQHVKSGRIDYQPAVGREFLDYAFMGYISEWGVWGYPSYGTAEKGARLAEEPVGRIVSWARATFARVQALRAGLISGSSFTEWERVPQNPNSE